MWANEESCAPSVTAMIRPISSFGKNPLGIMTNSTPVAVTVARNTISVMKRKRSATSRVRR